MVGENTSGVRDMYMIYFYANRDTIRWRDDEDGMIIDAYNFQGKKKVDRRIVSG